MGKTPTEVLRKTKAKAAEKGEDKTADKKPKGNALLDFIARVKRPGKKE